MNNGSSTILTAALDYFRRGWSVSVCCSPDHAGLGDWHKCDSPGKRPVHRWKKLQTERTTEAEIKKLFSQHPRSNVGLILGPVSGLIRIDVDGARGDELLREKSKGDLPPTLEFSSGGNGRGLLYRIPDGAQVKTTSDKGDGEHSELRFQAKGAQTVMPPSIHPSGRVYEWLTGHSPDDMEAAFAPLWLLEELKPGKRKTPKQKTPKQTSDNPEFEIDNNREPDPERDREIALSALNALSSSRADDRDMWLTIGMAAHSVDPSSAMLGAWESFSRLSTKFQEGECAEKWAGFNGDGGVTLGTLIHMAQQDGWTPPARKVNGHSTSGEVSSGGPIRNAIVVHTGEEKFVQPVPMTAIIKGIRARTNDWPRRVGSALFIHECADIIAWLENTPSLFGWLGSRCPPPPVFTASPGCHSREEVFHELRRVVKSYRTVETLPHEPMFPDHYYACDAVKPGDGKTIDSLLNRFSPATPVDRDLFLAMFATMFWGGAAGSRPAFLITSDDGRGAGKSKSAAMAAHLACGLIDLSANESIEEIKKRLLSPEGITKRVVLLDNVKTLRFSWAELESLITNPVISGKRMYVGEGQRPNALLWIITLNGASLSTDMAQRCVIVKVKRPKYSGAWEDETRAFIDKNRQALIGDLIGFLRGPAKELAKYSRWGTWERDILSRLPDPLEAQTVILERQGEADVEQEEAEVLEDYFRAQLTMLRYDIDRDRIFLPSAVVCKWVNTAANEQYGATAATRIVGQKIDEGKLPRLKRPKTNSYGRGFEWIGKDWNATDPIKTDINHRNVTSDWRDA